MIASMFDFSVIGSRKLKIEEYYDGEISSTDKDEV